MITLWPGLETECAYHIDQAWSMDEASASVVYLDAWVCTLHLTMERIIAVESNINALLYRVNICLKVIRQARFVAWMEKWNWEYHCPPDDWDLHSN